MKSMICRTTLSGAAKPTRCLPIRAKVPLRRFRCDARHDIVKCLRGKILRPGKPVGHGRFFHAESRECARCDLASICISEGRPTKSVVISDDYPALLRARRRKEPWSEIDTKLYQRHRWRSEGFHGEAKTWHGLGRAVRRGIANMRIQAFPIAAAVNLERLAAALRFYFRAPSASGPRYRRWRSSPRSRPFRFAPEAPTCSIDHSTDRRIPQQPPGSLDEECPVPRGENSAKHGGGRAAAGVAPAGPGAGQPDAAPCGGSALAEMAEARRLHRRRGDRRSVLCRLPRAAPQQVAFDEPSGAPEQGGEAPGRRCRGFSRTKPRLSG